MKLNDKSIFGEGSPQQVIAWCGWRMDLPGSWYPLRIQGAFSKGAMMIGDGEKPVLLVQWKRVPSRGFDATHWMRTRLKKQRVHASPQAPVPEGFDESAWMCGLELREGQVKSVWYGYCKAAGLLLELVTTNLGEGADPLGLLQQALAGLRPSGLEEPCRWSLFGTRFVSPPGFVLERYRLCSGDIALLLRSGKQEQILLRQVYPAGLALSRRVLPGWMETPPFIERRRQSAVPPASVSAQGMQGLLRSGWRRLPAPLGWCNPRFSIALAVVDSVQDRLRLVDHQHRQPQDDAMARWCLAQMGQE